jgi:hypothetical protein
MQVSTMPLMSRSQPVEVPALASLEDSATAVMGELRGSLTALLNRLPDPIARAVDLERSLRLDKKLAWQVFRLARSAGLSEIANVPSRPSVKRLLEAARRRKISRPLVDRVAAAFLRYEEFAVEHGGDREGLLSIVGGRTGISGEQFELKVRKAAFRAGAHLWGARAQMQVRTLIHHIRPGPEYVEDVILISADIGLQRVRQSDPLVMVRWWQISDQPTNHAAPSAAAAAPVDHQVNLLPEFCSRPLPRMLAKAGADGSVETELVIPAGRTGAVTLYSSQLFESAARSPQAVYFGRMFVTIPVETAVWEVLVPAGRTDPATARSVVYGRRAHPEQVYDERPADLLPPQGTAVYLGTLDGVPPLEDVPDHSAAVRHVLASHGWLDTRFDVYRCRIQYPMLHTLLCTRVDGVVR